MPRATVSGARWSVVRNRLFSATQPHPEPFLSLADRTLTSLVRQLAAQDVVELVHPFTDGV